MGRGAVDASATAPPDSDLAIVVPMLGRPHRVAPLLASIRAATPGARVLFACSPADYDVHRRVAESHAEMITVPFNPVGDYARKINAGYEHTTEPLIFTAADDLDFRPEWFQIACSYLKPGIGVVGTNDLGNPCVTSGKHATHSLVTRKYADTNGTIDRRGRILHEGYVHEYCDNELIGTAKYRGAFAMAIDAHVEHLHPHWGKAPTDRLYQQQRQRMRASHGLYVSRRRLWGE
jgi:hypothetical protein